MVDMRKYFELKVEAVSICTEGDGREEREGWK